VIDVQVTVNGESTDVGPSTTVGALVDARAGGRARVAVAVNGEVVPRSRWETTDLTAGDTIEVLTATAGG
jgi:sulfur carrier protein